MEFPIAYILKHKKHGTYCRIPKPTYCTAPHILEKYEGDKEWGAIFFPSKIEDAKMWPSLKKVKKFLGKKEIAQYYYVVGSDQTIIPAEDLFRAHLV